jgi:hypothetical protein
VAPVESVQIRSILDNKQRCQSWHTMLTEQQPYTEHKRRRLTHTAEQHGPMLQVPHIMADNTLP